jgi:DNA-directed RNA polymerase subunit M/transcription elongation factor TFIIS
MIKTKRGYECPKCKTITQGISEMQREPRSRQPPNHVYVLEEKEENLATVKQECPECGNKEAYHWFTSISGEHAGIRREATIVNFKCAKCSYRWTKTL